MGKADVSDKIFDPNNPPLGHLEVMPLLGTEETKTNTGNERLTALLLRAVVKKYTANSVEQLLGQIAGHIGVGDRFIPPQNTQNRGFGVALDEVLVEGLDMHLNHVTTKIEVLNEGSIWV